MSLSSRQLVIGGGLLAYTWLMACGGPEEFRSGRDGGLTGVGGSIETGSGGAGPGPGSGGARTGGAPGTGGRGTGGAMATGGRSTSSGGATETGGRGTGGASTGGRGTGGADTGSGGRGSGGRGSGGAAAGGRAAGGSGSGGRAAGGATGAGGASGTGPCAGLCSNPVTIPKGMNSGGLGTGVTCHQVTSMVQGIVCGNFTAPRTFSVNDTAVNCSGGGLSPPALRNGGYCMQATAGQTSSAYFTTY